MKEKSTHIGKDRRNVEVYKRVSSEEVVEVCFLRFDLLL